MLRNNRIKVTLTEKKLNAGETNRGKWEGENNGGGPMGRLRHIKLIKYV